MNEYCVFYHDQKFHKYYVYYSTGKYDNGVDAKPSNIDTFEHSRLTNILKDYCEKMQVWRNEIMSSKFLKLSFDYFLDLNKKDGSRFTNTNETNIMRFFNKYNKLYNSDYFDKISWNEYLKYEECNNGALMRCFHTSEFETIGFDFKMFYPNLLASQIVINGVEQPFYFPQKEGTRMKLERINFKQIQYGIYDCVIKASNPDFAKVFDFNSKHVYTHYDIKFAYKHREEYGITIELIADKEYNALIYEKLVNGKSVFKNWLDRIKELKGEFPKNGLIKLLSSSMWGYLSKINRRYFNDKELDENPDIIFDYDDDESITHLCTNERDGIDGTTDYFLVNKTQPYCLNYRLKPFLQSFTRCVMGQLCLDIGVEKVIRVNTDNITFDRNILSEKDLEIILKISPDFIEEAKTTGHFYIKNINNFTRI